MWSRVLELGTTLVVGYIIGWVCAALWDKLIWKRRAAALSKTDMLDLTNNVRKEIKRRKWKKG